MKNSINFETQFISGFQQAHCDNFSLEGYYALFKYFTNYEENIGEEIEFDPVAICCDWTEYDSLEDVQIDYGDIDKDSEYLIILPSGGVLVQAH